MIIKFKVYNQIIQKDYTSHVISDSQKYLYFAFDFTDDWNGASKFVQMTSGDKFYELQLDNSNKVQVPWELLVGGGKISVALYGSITGGVLITTNNVTVNVEKSGIVEDETSLVPTENAANNLLNTVSATAAQSASNVLGSKVNKSGDTMTGAITFNAMPALKKINDNSRLDIYGGSAETKGANIELFGKDYAGLADFAGAVRILSCDTSGNLKQLLFQSNGDLRVPQNIIVNGNFYEKNLLVARDDNSETQNYYHSMGLIDKNGVAVATTIGGKETNGDIVNIFRALKDDTHYTQIALRQKMDGTHTETILSSPANTNNSTQIATTAYVKNQFVTRDFSFADCSFTVGTIGTRGFQKTVNASLTGYTIVGVFMAHATGTDSCHYQTFMSNNTVYLNGYRATASAFTASGTNIVRVLYMSN